VRVAEDTIVDSSEGTRQQLGLANAASKAVLVKGFVRSPYKLHRVHCLAANSTLLLGRYDKCG
jgi:indole-3-glycerol phosphate synthase